MNRLSFVCVVVCVCLCGFVVGDERQFLEAFPTTNEADFSKMVQEVNRYPQERVEEAQPFSWACPSVPVPAPTDDIRKLKPGHIKVVMAMGDSITAAMSAKDTNVLNLKEYRGLSFPIGSDAGANTLPNFFKQYAPTGYPIGGSTGIGKRTIATNGLNAAVSGAINSDMLGQAEWLVQQLKANTKINLKEDWKVLTIWIGSNNLCDVCNNDAANNAKNFRSQIFSALDYLRNNVPRLFVNLLANLDITRLYDFNTGACTILHGYECSCGANRNAAVREGVKNHLKQYVATAYDIAANYTSKGNPSFAVVVQPFLVDTVIYNRTFLSAADCFHPSALAHSVAGTALWNAMITPAAKKKIAWDHTEVPICADANTLLYTD